MASKPFRTYTLQLSIDHNTGEMFINLPHSLEHSIGPRNLQDLLPAFSRAAPFLNKQNKVVWKIKAPLEKLNVLYHNPIVYEVDGDVKVRRADSQDLQRHRLALEQNDKGFWIDEDGHKLYIKEA
jgi:hypothetical protein